MKRGNPIFAAETTAARLMDMPTDKFRDLVEAGHFPRAREIAPGVLRWSVADLMLIASGEASEGMGDIPW